VLCWAMVRFSQFEQQTRFVPRLTIFAVILILATAAYIGLTWLIHCPEVEEVWGIARRAGPRPLSGG